MREVLLEGRARTSKEGVFGQGEVEAFLLWPPIWGKVLGGSKVSGMIHKDAGR